MTKQIYKFDPDHVRFNMFVFYKKHFCSIFVFFKKHRNIDRIIGHTRCLSNQLGYVSLGEHLSFDTGKIFEI